MNIIMVINLKGGVGKTTTSVALSESLASFGYHTLLIDADHQCMSGEMVMGEERFAECDKAGCTLHDLLSRLLDPKFPPEGIARFVQHAVSDIDGGMITLSCIPCSLRIEEFQRNMTRARRSFKTNEEFIKVWSQSHGKLRRWLQERFDYVVIDCPPTLAIQVRFMMSLGDCFLVPAVPEHSAVRGVRYLQEYLRRVNYRKPSIGMLWSMVDDEDSAHQKFIDPEELGSSLPSFDLPRPFTARLPKSPHLAGISTYRPSSGSFRDKYGSHLHDVLRGLVDEISDRCAQLKMPSGTV